MIHERKSFQGVDPLSTMELLDSQFLNNFTEHVSIEVKRAALQFEIFHPLAGLLLLTKVIPNTSWLTTSPTDRDDVVVCFEKSPEQVISNLPFCEEWSETLGDGFVTVLNGLDQEVKSLKRFTVVDIISRVDSTCLQFRKIIVQQVSLDLVRSLAMRKPGRPGVTVYSRFVFPESDPLDILQHDSQDVSQTF